MEKREISRENVVKVDIRIVPGVVVRELHAQAHGLVRYLRVIQFHVVTIYAGLKLSAEQIHSHNTEDEPENKADEQHIKDGGYCLNKCIDDNLYFNEDQTYWINN